MGGPFFTIVVVSFNAAQTIRGTIDSVLTQGFQDYEIVDHTVLVAERVWDVDEVERNYSAQKALFFKTAKTEIEEQITEKLAQMNTAGQRGYGLKVTIDRELLLALFAAASQRDENDAKLAEDFRILFAEFPPFIPKS